MVSVSACVIAIADHITENVNKLVMGPEYLRLLEEIVESQKPLVKCAEDCNEMLRAVIIFSGGLLPY